MTILRTGSLVQSRGVATLLAYWRAQLDEEDSSTSQTRSDLSTSQTRSDLPAWARHDAAVATAAAQSQRAARARRFLGQAPPSLAFRSAPPPPGAHAAPPLPPRDARRPHLARTWSAPAGGRGRRGRGADEDRTLVGVEAASREPLGIEPTHAAWLSAEHASGAHGAEVTSASGLGAAPASAEPPRAGALVIE